MAIIILLLQWLEFRFLILEHQYEIYIGIISIFFLLFMTEPSEVPSWNPMDDRGLRFLAVFCAAIQSFYQIYLTRKLKRAASILNA